MNNVDDKNNREPRIVPSEEIFLGARIVRIEHAGQHYLLRLTKENKLILTK
ncbi:MAG TPA: hemin uptake protein HemP [Pseudomonadales bacterium]|nr:hemin uptake protein HemP [Pseudomonadales bacterium]